MLQDDAADPFDGFEYVLPAQEEVAERVRVSVSAGLLAEIEAAALAATSGPWAYDDSGVWTTRGAGPITQPLLPGDPEDGIARVGDSYARGGNYPTENMRHIARMDPETTLALVRRLRALEEYYASSEAYDQAGIGVFAQYSLQGERLEKAKEALRHA
jgi:hypothetical protein